MGKLLGFGILSQPERESTPARIYEGNQGEPWYARTAEHSKRTRKHDAKRLKKKKRREIRGRENRRNPASRRNATISIAARRRALNFGFRGDSSTFRGREKKNRQRAFRRQRHDTFAPCVCKHGPRSRPKGAPNPELGLSPLRSPLPKTKLTHQSRRARTYCGLADHG